MDYQIVQKNCLFLLDQKQFQLFLRDRQLVEASLPKLPFCSDEDYETVKLSIWAQLNSERLVSVRNWDKAFVYPANYYLMEIMYNHHAVEEFLTRFAHYTPANYVLTYFILQKTTEAIEKILDRWNLDYYASFNSRSRLYYDAEQKEHENEVFQYHQRQLIQALIKDRNNDNIYGASVCIAVRNATGWLLAHNIEPLHVTKMETF